MLDLDQRAQKGHPSSLAEWAYRAMGLQGVRLRTRLRGNNLHILCEASQCPDAATVVSQFIRALKASKGTGLPIDPKQPIYQVILYGRAVDQQRPEWIEAIDINQLDKQLERWQQVKAAVETAEPTNDAARLVSNESLARSGSPEAIARYLSETLSPMGVSVKVFIQTLPDQSSTPTGEAENSSETANLNRRLWVICNSDYSPDASLLAEPVAQHLRELNLEGFRDAVIRSQVSGESDPDWLLRIDLTPPEAMLKDWACWGDVQAIARLLNQTLADQGIEVRAVLKDLTLHLFCSVLSIRFKRGAVPDKQGTMEAIAPILDALAPQGIQAATVYGVEARRRLPIPEQETPVWVDWLNLPGGDHAALAPTPLALAQQGNQEALTFLLQRLLNPDLDRRLATGGIRITIRRKQDLLHIMSEAPICPLQSQVGQPIAKFLRQLKIPGIAGVRIYGRRAGQSSPLWNYGVDFVSRRRRAPEVTPEFAADDVYVSDLMPTEETVEAGALTKPDLQDWVERSTGGLRRTLRQWLCYTQLFIPARETKELAPTSPHSVNTANYSAAQAVKVTFVWGTLGLLLVLQADWVLGYVLRSLSEGGQPAGITNQQPQTKTVVKSIPVPQMSLQKSTGERGNVFNSSGFTREGENSVVVTNEAEKGSATTAAILAAARSQNPSFNNRLLDEKLALYQQTCLLKGPPDVLIVGSSRAMRGIDPATLQAALASQGYPDVEIFNLGINGATAQIVDLIVRRILTPDQLPKMIIWADGSRAFNSGRADATYSAIAASEGYQTLAIAQPQPAQGGEPATAASANNQSGTGEAAFTVSYQGVNQWLNQALASLSATYPQRNQLKTVLQQQYATLVTPQPTVLEQAEASKLSLESPMKEGSIDFDGFLPLSVRFNPSTYYKQHAKVTGDYDNDYESFQLLGQQDAALTTLLQFTQARQISLVFVNLPLTKNYLDPVRSKYETEFQQYMQQLAIGKGLIFRDLSQLWPSKNDYFSDPSHLNRYGAAEVSNHLATDPMIPWPQKNN